MFLVSAKKLKTKSKKAQKQIQLVSSNGEKVEEDDEDANPDEEDFQQCKINKPILKVSYGNALVF